MDWNPCNPRTYVQHSRLLGVCFTSYPSFPPWSGCKFTLSYVCMVSYAESLNSIVFALARTYRALTLDVDLTRELH